MPPHHNLYLSDLLSLCDLSFVCLTALTFSRMTGIAACVCVCVWVSECIITGAADVYILIICLHYFVVSAMGDTYIVDMKATRAINKWASCRLDPSSSAGTLDVLSANVLMKYPVMLSKLSRVNWPGRLVRPSNVPQVDRGLFAVHEAKSPNDDNQVTCYRISRHKNSAQANTGQHSTSSQATLKYFIFRTDECAVYPLSTWLWYSLTLFPTVLYRLSQAMLTVELSVRLNQSSCHLKSDANIVLFPDRLSECGGYVLPWMSQPTPMDREIEQSTATSDRSRDSTITQLQSARDSSTVTFSSLLQATTMAAAHDVVCLERMEFMGDSFLQLVTSLAVYDSCPLTATEGQLTDARMKLVSNASLQRVALQLDLLRYCASRAFRHPDHFLPPCFTSRLSVSVFSVVACMCHGYRNSPFGGAWMKCYLFTCYALNRFSYLSDA